jgi:small subunit ribosomal protein S9
MIGTVDVEATVAGGGPSGQSGAIRWGIACGLRSFVSQDMVEKMRIGKIKCV